MDHQDHLSRIADLSLCLNNRDTLGAEIEARNLSAGHPAYWYRGRTSAAMWVVELSRCEEHNFSFLRALEAFIERHPRINVLEILDGVIPLNEEAVHELSIAYRFQSSFRDDLADRERKAIFDPEYFPGMDAEMRARWEAQYAECQYRWEQRYVAGLKDVSSPKAALAVALATVALDDAARVAVEGHEIEQVA